MPPPTVDATAEALERLAAASVELVPVRRKRGRPRDPLADGRILDAAAALILEHGYDNMTVDEVAARAKVGKATVYRRWAKKEDLAVAAMKQLYDEQMPTPDTGHIRSDLRASIASVLAFAHSRAGAAYLRTCIAESVRDPRIAALYREANDRAEAGAVLMFRRAVQRGQVRADANVGAAVQIVAGILTVRTITSRPLPRTDELESLVDLVLRGCVA